MTRDEKYMNMAIAQAQAALASDEIAVGAVIVHKDIVIAEGYNLRETTNDPTAHAEIIAIRKAADLLSDWRLTDCELYCTLEPCAMCAGAIMNSRIKRLVFGAFDPAAGFFGSIDDLSLVSLPASYIEVIGGVEENRCRELLKASVLRLRQNYEPLI
ncbi:MAG: nucleoside deaminase [Oscillospiraceae bacterium]|nr:nucleoside deaminase [Oscillospiraceae bacterium]